MANWIISDETDQAVRSYLSSMGGTDSDLSAFVDQAVRSRILRETVREVQSQNAELSEQEAMKLANEAVAWARENRS